ncbi:unnamed protein product [Lasius platythorax]|uniref:RNase H type-1 domain-containing protein n=1 Tax=Lasius platythorax TaxID=488582 RepID=A0AAV2NC01_9HYME
MPIDVESGTRFGVDFNEHQLKNFFKEQYNLRDDLIVVYTDGSKNEVNISVGCSFYIEQEEMVFTMSLDSNASVFTAEACAIAKALLWLLEKKCSEDILIYCRCSVLFELHEGAPVNHVFRA